jgi:hypothetical protein
MPLLPASAAGAPEKDSGKAHSLLVRITNNGRLYSRSFKIEDALQLNSSGEVKGKKFVFNGRISPLSGDSVRLEYQLELSGGHTVDGRFLQAQGALTMSPNSKILVLDCGPWAASFTLDRKKGVRPAGYPGFMPGQGNYRVTMKAAAGGNTENCRFITNLGEQVNIVDSVIEGDTRYGFTFNGLLSPYGKGAAFNLHYQAENSFGTGKKRQSAGGTELLPLRKKKKGRVGGGLDIEFLVDGRPAPDKRNLP